MKPIGFDVTFVYLDDRKPHTTDIWVDPDNQDTITINVPKPQEILAVHLERIRERTFT